MMGAFWQFLTSNDGRAALAIAAIVVSGTLGTTFFFLNKRRRALVYEILSMTRVVSIKEDLAQRIQVLVDGAVTQNLGIVQVRIANTGNEPIKRTDFVRAISFSVRAPARIIEATISECKPAGLEPNLIKQDRRALVEPLLLNSGDSLILKLLIADFDGNIYADSRVEGLEMRPQVGPYGGKWIPLLFRAIEIVLGIGAIAGASELGISVRPAPNDFKE